MQLINSRSNDWDWIVKDQSPDNQLWRRNMANSYNKKTFFCENSYWAHDHIDPSSSCMGVRLQLFGTVSMEVADELARGTEESLHNNNTDTVNTRHWQHYNENKVSTNQNYSSQSGKILVLEKDYRSHPPAALQLFLDTQTHFAIICKNRNQCWTESTRPPKIVESCHQTLSKHFSMCSLTDQLFNSLRTIHGSSYLYHCRPSLEQLLSIIYRCTDLLHIWQKHYC